MIPAYRSSSSSPPRWIRMRLAELTIAAGNLYFSADGGDGKSNELWKTTLTVDRTYLFYTACWQVIEERENGSSDPSNQYVWSPVYVNA